MSAVNRVLLELQGKAFSQVEEENSVNPAHVPTSLPPDAQQQSGDQETEAQDDPTSSTAEDQDQTSQCQPMETQHSSATAINEQVRQQARLSFAFIQFSDIHNVSCFYVDGLALILTTILVRDYFYLVT